MWVFLSPEQVAPTSGGHAQGRYHLLFLNAWTDSHSEEGSLYSRHLHTNSSVDPRGSPWEALYVDGELTQLDWRRWPTARWFHLYVHTPELLQDTLTVMGKNTPGIVADGCTK